MNFIDDIRKDPETWRTTIYGGFDPDLHNSGLARVDVELSSHGRKRVAAVHAMTFSVSKKLKEKKAATAMIETILANRHEFNMHEAIVEAQQLYPNNGDTARKVTAIANDLLCLAWVSGAAYSAFMLERSDVKLLLPSEWKKQRKKENQHAQASEIIKADKATIYYGASGMATHLENFDTVSGHAMDAVCMALTEAGYVV